MKRLSTFNRALLAAGTLGGLSFGSSAAAQTDAQIQAIEQQIKALQAQLGQVKADLAKRDRALKAAQQQAKAAQDQAAAASAQAAQLAASPPAQIAAAPPPERPLPKGQFRVGELTVTLGGFAAAEGVYRSRNEASSIATSFNSIPFANSVSLRRRPSGVIRSTP